MLSPIPHTLRVVHFLLVGTLLAHGYGQTDIFDAREATISSVHNALFSDGHTCRSIVSAFLSRIEALNPIVNAIITLDDTALDVADSLDEQYRRGNVSGSLFCVPVLLKDNFDLSGCPTTAGCLVLSSLAPVRDAPTVSALRHAGAVILGKTNLHEFALEGLSTSSLGGQTLNPYDLSRTPGGSSGGTGAAIAASFAVLGTGTDTVNSLRSPASANNLFSFRPTRGLISRFGVIPVSYTQDTVGAIGRCLSDLATILTVWSKIGFDSRDNVTSHAKAALPVDYSAFLARERQNHWSKLSIGVLQPFFNQALTNETTPVNALMSNVISCLYTHNATVVHLDTSDVRSVFDPDILLSLDVQRYEYRQQLTSYLADPTLIGPHPKSMEELYLNTSQYFVIPKQHKHIGTALTSSTSSPEYIRHLDQIKHLTRNLSNLFSIHNLDAIIYPQQRNLVVPIGSPNQHGRNGILAALTGSPVITIPIGFSNATGTAPIGIPVGMEILGKPWSEGKLLSIAQMFDDILHARKPPVTAGMDRIVEVNKRYEVVPNIKPRGLSNELIASSRDGVLMAYRQAINNNETCEG